MSTTRGPMDSQPAWADVRGAFAHVATRAYDVLSRDVTAVRWGDSSVCKEMTVGGLAGHLLGVLRAFERRCDCAPPTGAVVVDPAMGYDVVRLVHPADLDEPAFKLVRENAERVGRLGHPAIVARYADASVRLQARLAYDVGDRLVELPDPAKATTLLEYTITRIVELVVHADDLAESTGEAIEPPSEPTAGLVINFLGRAVRSRLGDSELIRTLAGRRPADLLRAL